jgi:hypothetical protein
VAPVGSRARNGCSMEPSRQCVELGYLSGSPVWLVAEWASRRLSCSPRHPPFEAQRRYGARFGDARPGPGWARERSGPQRLLGLRAGRRGSACGSSTRPWWRRPPAIQLSPPIVTRESFSCNHLSLLQRGLRAAATVRESTACPVPGGAIRHAQKWWRTTASGLVCSGERDDPPRGAAGSGRSRSREGPVERFSRGALNQLASTGEGFSYCLGEIPPPARGDFRRR